MYPQYETFQKLSSEGVSSVMTRFDAMTKGFQSVAAELGDYSKRSFEEGAAVMKDLVGARSIEKVVEIQTAYLKTSYESAMAEASKVGGLYTAIAKDASKPFEGLAASAGLAR